MAFRKDEIFHYHMSNDSVITHMVNNNNANNLFIYIPNRFQIYKKAQIQIFRLHDIYF